MKSGCFITRREIFTAVNRWNVDLKWNLLNETKSRSQKWAFSIIKSLMVMTFRRVSVNIMFRWEDDEM